MELVQKEKRLITKWDEISESIEITEQCLKKYLFSSDVARIEQKFHCDSTIQIKIDSTF
jgi:NADH:ubiquinone oxidoreductase subunit D